MLVVCPRPPELTRHSLLAAGFAVGVPPPSVSAPRPESRTLAEPSRAAIWRACTRFRRRELCRNGSGCRSITLLRRGLTRGEESDGVQ